MIERIEMIAVRDILSFEGAVSKRVDYWQSNGHVVEVQFQAELHGYVAMLIVKRKNIRRR